MISANSCNIVRVICEIPLYFYAYFRSQHFPAPLGFSIPISNMKSTYTLCLCEQMGLPISRILLACRPDSAGEQLFRFGRFSRSILHMIDDGNVASIMQRVENREWVEFPLQRVREVFVKIDRKSVV